MDGRVDCEDEEESECREPCREPWCGSEDAEVETEGREPLGSEDKEAETEGRELQDSGNASWASLEVGALTEEEAE